MAAILEIIRVLFIAIVGAIVQATAGSDGVIHTPGDLPDLSYTLAYEQGELPALAVGLSFKGEDDGSSTISLPEEWGGTSEPAADILTISSTTDDGDPVEITRSGPRTWTITHAPGERINCEYRIAPGVREPTTRGNDYRTAVAPDMVHAIGHLALAYPDHMRTPEPREIAIDLEGLAQPGWSVVSSYGPGPNKRVVRMPGEKFLHSVIIAGNGRLLERQIGSNRLGVYIQSDKWEFDDSEFAELSERIVHAERDFFADHTDPWFLVSIVPQGESRPGGYSLGGTGLNNAFALFCAPNISLEPGSEQLRRVERLLAHEYMHTWIGGKININDKPEPCGYWFSEGFTDFLARRVLHASGLWGDAEYAADLSEALSRYDSNPERDADNAAIAQGFWSNRNIGDLPYRRGDLIALAIDERLRTSTPEHIGDRSVDTLARDMLTRAVENGVEFTTESVLALVESYTDAEFADRIRACVEHGGEVPIPDRTTAPALELTSRSMRVSDPGFDFEAARTNKAIRGVRPGSGAELAGIRDGMTLVSFSMDGVPNGPPKAVAVVKNESGESRTIEYEAVSAPKPVRAYMPLTRSPG